MAVSRCISWSVALLLATLTSGAAVHICSTMERAELVAKIAAASSGDIIFLPAGSANYSNTVTINKALSIIGSGTNQTVIYDWITNSTRVMFDITAPTNTVSRIGGFSVIRGTSTAAGSLDSLFRLLGNGVVRIDHVIASNTPVHVLGVSGGVYGVADHVVHVGNNSGGTWRTIVNRNGDFGDPSKVWGDWSWENARTWGTTNAFYLETSEVTLTGALGMVDTFRGGRLCVRSNYVVDSRFSSHGTESSGRPRSTCQYEIYNNVLTNSDVNIVPLDVRGGGCVIYSNAFNGGFNINFTLNNYRQFACFNPWLCSDGTMNWDSNDTSDGAGTPGGAGDGVFEGGQATGGGSDSLSDSTKAWTTNQWQGYVLRKVYTNTATSGGVRTATVSGAGWTANQFVNHVITKVSDNTKSRITSNTSDTLTASTSAYAIDFTGGGQFILSLASEISSNTGTNIVVQSQGGENSNYVFASGDYYEIRKVIWALDGCGRGLSDAGVIDSTSTPNHSDLNQDGTDICYQWENYRNGSAMSWLANQRVIVEGRDYTNAVVKPSYSGLTYPHPLTATNSATPVTATVTANNTQDFDGAGGFTPYIFTIFTNNSGGSINSSTGLYTAGPVFNVTDTIRTWDALGNFFDSTVTVTLASVTSQPGGLRPITLFQ